MLEVVGLTKVFKTVRAVDGVSFTVNPGEIVGLLGPNGAGKTTMMRCITTILEPTAGSVRINGHDLQTQMDKAKRGLAFVPEVPNLYELLTVEEHIRFVAMCFDTLSVYDSSIDALLHRYSLTDKRKALVATLSKGMRQKLSIACAMVHNANVFLFDEPIIGVDPAGVAEFKAEMARGREQGYCYLVSTHLLDVAEKLCDRVVIMNKGKTVAQGTVDELRNLSHMQGADLEQLFLSLTKPNEAPPLPH
ncbi:MAG: ABC transporter ATP-binding protein [Armatimonadetes bacterium]|nr:ABC transporter ATP-binding protein [Armatimonadota bacterium]